MVREAGVDGILRGEGEQSLVELLAVLADGGSAAVLGVRNWSFCRDGDVIANPVRPTLRTWIVCLSLTEHWSMNGIRSPGGARSSTL